MNRRRQIFALLEAWMIQVIFGKSRRAGEQGSGSLTPTVFSQGFLSWAFAAIAFVDASPRAFIAGTMSFVVLLATIALIGELDDERERPADRDLVKSGPISAITVVLARLLRQALVTLLYAGGLAIAPAILSGFKTGSYIVVPITFVLFTCLISAAASAILGAVTRIIAALAGSDRASSFSSAVRALLFGGGFLGMLLGLRAMLSGADTFPGGREVLEVMPMTLAANAITGASAQNVLLALAFPLLALVLTLATSSLAARSVDASRRAVSPLQWLLTKLVRDPKRRGITSFSLAMLSRERSFRLRALPLLGLPAAAVLLALKADLEPSKLSWFLALVHQLPLAYLPFLLWFVPYAEQPRASWLVAIRVSDPIESYRRGLEIAFAILFLPVQAMLFSVHAGLRGAAPAAAVSLASLGIAWLVLPLLLRELTRPAFAADPDELELPTDMSGSLRFAVIATFAAFALEAGLRKFGLGLAVLLFLCGAFVLFTRARGEASESSLKN